jgi:hypothetical protein
VRESGTQGIRKEGRNFLTTKDTKTQTAEVEEEGPTELTEGTETGCGESGTQGIRKEGFDSDEARRKRGRRGIEA